MKLTNMNELIAWFEGLGPVMAALVATLFTWGMTAAGAALVFPFRTMNRRLFDGMLGFTGGVMVAAVFGRCWRLPSTWLGEKGLQSGAARHWVCTRCPLLYGLDKLTPHLHINFKKEEAEGPKLLAPDHAVLAITLHNIPEGLAVEVLFGGAALGLDGATTAGAVALAVGIGIQNFPEGLSVSMPLRHEEVSRTKLGGTVGCRPWWNRSRCGRGLCRHGHASNPSLRAGFRSRSHAVRGGGGGHS